MSVMGHVRTVSENLFTNILAHPEIATILAGEQEACDFEPTSYLARWEDSGGRDPARRAQALERGRARMQRVEKEHVETWAALPALGVAPADVDVALDIWRAGL